MIGSARHRLIGSGRHRARRGAVASCGFALVAASAVWVAGGLAGSPAEAATLPANCSQAGVGAAVVCRFGFTGGEQTFTVPARVSSVDLAAVGASGGAVSNSDGGGPGGTASVSGYTVTGGSTLYVEVGGVGGDGFGRGSAGGFNGGGAGGPGTDFSGFDVSGAGGGGASDVRTVSGSLASRVLVAAAGGGGGPNSAGGGPGAAGGAAYNGTYGGGGATTSAGGAGGNSPVKTAAVRTGSSGSAAKAVVHLSTLTVVVAAAAGITAAAAAARTRPAAAGRTTPLAARPAPRQARPR